MILNYHRKNYKSSCPEVFFKKRVIKSFTKFTGKRPALESLLNENQVFRPATLLKGHPNTGTSCGFCEIFKNACFEEHRKWLLLK